MPDLRQLSGFESLAYAYASRRPYQFSLAAHLGDDVAAERLDHALSAIQDSHPMLRVAVDGDATGGPRFTPVATPIPLARRSAATTWQRVAAEEQAIPIDLATGPLMRAVRVEHIGGTTVVLTFSHVICDGMGAKRALLDLVRVLDGAVLSSHRFPLGQEHWADRNPSPFSASISASTSEPSAIEPGPPASVPTALASIRPFDGAVPSVMSADLDVRATEDLIRVCHRNRTTVHAALVAAATTVLGTSGRLVDVATPIDLRRAAGLPDDVAVRFTGAHTRRRVSPEGFWQLARSVRHELSARARPQAVLAELRGLAELGPASADVAELGMQMQTTADVVISNLGLVRPPRTKAVRLIGIHGPVLLNQLVGEQVLGITTTNGILRAVHTSYSSVPGLLAEIVGVLRDQIAGPSRY